MNDEDIIVLTPEIEELVPDMVDTPIIDTIDDTDVNAVDIVEPQPQQIIYTIGNYLGTLQESVISIWKLHLHAKKHWIHVELDSLYHNMLELVDTVIEQYQGIIASEISTTDYQNVLFVNDETTELIFLMQLREFVINGRKQLIDENLTELWSSIDDMIGTLDQTIYKLNSFKEEYVPTFEAFCYEKYRQE